MHHINIISTATTKTIKGDQNPIKCYFSSYSTPHPCHATFIAMQIVHHSSWHACLLVASIHMLVHFIYVGLAGLVFLRIDTEQGIYPESQEHYPDPSLSSTELPGKHYHMLAYIQYLLPLSYSCIIESRLH